jgi:hypothetical protein
VEVYQLLQEALQLVRLAQLSLLLAAVAGLLLGRALC